MCEVIFFSNYLMNNKKKKYNDYMTGRENFSVEIK